VGVGGFGTIEKCIVVEQVERGLGMACFTGRIRVTVAPRLLVLMVTDFNGFHILLRLPQPVQLLFPHTPLRNDQSPSNEIVIVSLT